MIIAKPITYRKLLEALTELSNEQLDMSVTIWDGELGESLPVMGTILVSELPPREYDEQDMDDSQPLLDSGTRFNKERN